MKKNKKIFNILLNIYRLRHPFKNIWKEFGFYEMFKLCFYNLIWNREKIIYLKNLNLYVKPNFFLITTLIEIYNRELYKNLSGLNSVLDLWAYIWESSIYLAKNNKKVVAFEPSIEKFKLLEKNIKLEKNIQWFNFAVVDNEKIQSLTFHERDPFDFCSSSVNEKKLTKEVTVVCKDIFTILDKYDFDWLKMDIEWWEFPIVKSLVDNNKFPFKKWVVEFHFAWENIKSKIEQFHDFCIYLNKNNYDIRLFDNDNILISLDNQYIWINKNLLYLNLEFIKKDEK